jgi:L-amino acid N-acyltransferase YncA
MDTETVLGQRRPTDAGIRVVPMTAEHAAAVLEIYQIGLDSGQASFETDAPAWDAWDAGHLPQHRFVALDGDAVVGWVAVSAVSDRCVYTGVVENSVYVHPAARGRHVGRALLDELIASTEKAGIWTIQSGIFPDNLASLRLHEAAGFRIVGRRERIGQQHGRWRDVLSVERRSPLI